MSSMASPSIESVPIAATAVTDQQNALPALQRELTELRARYEMQSQELSVAETTIHGLAARLVAANTQCAARDARIKELERSIEAKEPNSGLVRSQPVSLAKEQEKEQFKRDNAGGAGARRKLSESQGISSPFPKPVHKQQGQKETEKVKSFAEPFTQPAPKPTSKPIAFGKATEAEILWWEEENARAYAEADAYAGVDVVALMRQAQAARLAAKNQAADKVGPKPAQDTQPSGIERPRN